MWSWQEIGSLAGLLTAAFTAYDRLIRGRPEVALVPSGPKGGISFDIHVKNVGSGAILIRNVWAFPRVFNVMRSETRSAIIAGTEGEPIMAHLDRDEWKAFPLFRLGEDDRNFVIVCSWRKSSAPWLPQIPKLIFTSGRSLHYLSKNY